MDQPQSASAPAIYLNDPTNRKLKVVTIGAGLCGILNAYNIQTRCKNVEHVIFEKNSDIGGTWFENRYPGCACDVPSHSYAYHFALNPDWPRFQATSEDIWQYLDRVCKVFDLRKYMRFNIKVIASHWEEDSSQWRVRLHETRPEGDKEFDVWCDVLLYATGFLNHWKWPDIDGLHSFKGRVIHSASWPADYQEESWKGERVAVLGSGASSIQIVPSMQPFVKHMEVFVRTGVWFVELDETYPSGYIYSEEEKRAFRNDPSKLIEHVKYIDNRVNGLWPLFYLDGDAQKTTQSKFRKRMADLIKDQRLLEGFTPKFSVGCRCLALGDPYIKAIQKDNVHVSFTPIVKVTPSGVVGGDGLHREVDTIVCATGFDFTFKPRFPVIGRRGVSLAEKWRDGPLAYFGVTVPDMPNFVTFAGVPAPLQNGAPILHFQSIGDYAIKMIEKLQREDIKSLEPKQDVTDAFGMYCQKQLQKLVFVDDCRSTYKHNRTGKVFTIYPGSVLHYAEMLSNPRWEDYHIEYKNKEHMWAFMGTGETLQEKGGQDLNFYILESKLDPKWLKEIRA